MNVSYPYRLQQTDKGGYQAQFIDLEEVRALGKTLQEAQLKAAEQLSAALEERIDDGFNVPRPSKAQGENIFHAEPEPDLQVSLLVHWALEDNGATLADLARSLGTSWASANRLKKPGNNPTLKNLREVAARLGKRLVVTFE